MFFLTEYSAKPNISKVETINTHIEVNKVVNILIRLRSLLTHGATFYPKNRFSLNSAFCFPIFFLLVKVIKQ